MRYTIFFLFISIILTSFIVTSCYDSTEAELESLSYSDDLSPIASGPAQDSSNDNKTTQQDSGYEKELLKQKVIEANKPVKTFYYDLDYGFAYNDKDNKTLAFEVEGYYDSENQESDVEVISEPNCIDVMPCQTTVKENIIIKKNFIFRKDCGSDKNNIDLWEKQDAEDGFNLGPLFDQHKSYLEVIENSDLLISKESDEQTYVFILMPSEDSWRDYAEKWSYGGMFERDFFKSFDSRVWVDKETFLIKKHNTSIRAGSSKKSDYLVIDVGYSEFDKNITINPPDYCLLSPNIKCLPMMLDNMVLSVVVYNHGLGDLKDASMAINGCESITPPPEYGDDIKRGKEKVFGFECPRDIKRIDTAIALDYMQDNKKQSIDGEIYWSKK
jgi:hypothetical protein